MVAWREYVMQSIQLNPIVSAGPIERLTLTAAEAAKALGVSKVTLWRWEKRGILLPLPGIHMRLYSVASLRRFSEQGGAN
jgi:hypothetical protein